MLGQIPDCCGVSEDQGRGELPESNKKEPHVKTWAHYLVTMSVACLCLATMLRVPFHPALA